MAAVVRVPGTLPIFIGTLGACAKPDKATGGFLAIIGDML